MTEEVFNTALGNALKRAMPEWRDHILIEKTGTLREAAGRHVDVLVAHPSMPPVAIEASFAKRDADADARARLGLHYAGNGREILTAVAVEPPESDRNLSSLHKRHTIRYALHQKARRFPESGFIHGNVLDLARLVASAAVPKEEVESVADSVAGDAAAAANALEPHIKQKDLADISKSLYQRSALTGMRTTMVLWLNALLVQRRLYGGVHDIPGLTDMPSECAEAWRAIHRINWRAIFGPAIDVLDRTRMMAPAQVREALALLIKAVEQIETAGLGSDINVGAELFPKMAGDRKESAAFYTQAATAELLAALTITPDMAEWPGEPFRRFRIADMTCGTGTLLRFGYRQVKAYHRSGKHTAKTLIKLHRDAMEHGLVGTDVSPIAAHLTSTSLALDTKQPYGDTHVGWVGVGKRNRTGAIEYVARNSVQDLLMGAVGSSGGRGGRSAYNSVVVKDESIDVVLMNPPYSRTRGGQSTFDIAGLTDGERKECQKRWGNLIRNEPCVKTAGMAATFLCIARKKVKPGGRIGFVLPRTAAFADTWERTRDMVETDFEDITAVAVSSGKALGRDAMSADTMMEEMLLTATRRRAAGGSPPPRSPVKCVTLYDPVTRAGEAAEVAKAILGTNSGPVVAGDEIGASRMFETDGGRPWSYVGTVHGDVAAIADGLSRGMLRDLEGNRLLRIPMTTLGELFVVGPTHHLIGHQSGREPIGAFTLYPVTGAADAAGMHRSLWRADSKTQTKLIVSPTHKGIPYRRDKADGMWGTRSMLFYSRGMRWNTQGLVAAATERPAMGGSGWTSLHHSDVRMRKAFALWANSIYGILVYWSRGQRTHSGRSRLQVRAIGKVPCPAFGSLGENALAGAAAGFDGLSTLELLPAYEAERDGTRAEINRIISGMLGAPEYDSHTLTKLWCAEPSVRGMKR